MTHLTWLEKKRKELHAAAMKLPDPRPRQEGWRETPIHTLQLDDLFKTSREKKASTTPSMIFPDNASLIRMGSPSQLNQLPEGVKLYNVMDEKGVVTIPSEVREKLYSTLTQSENKIALLTAALSNNTTILHIEGKRELRTPLVIVDTAGQPTTILVVADKNSKADIVHITNHADRDSATLLELFLSDNASISYTSLFDSRDHVLISSAYAVLQKNANLQWFFSTTSDHFSKVSAEINHKGTGSQSTVTSLCTGNTGTTALSVDTAHNAKNTSATIDNKTLVNGFARSIYRGTIRITKEGQQTSSFLTDTTLKLSSDAAVFTTPSLFIDQNDVKASHASTISEISEEHLFYLMARGIPRELGKELIVMGFVQPALDTLPPTWITDHLRSAIHKKMSIQKKDVSSR